MGNYKIKVNVEVVECDDHNVKAAEEQMMVVFR